jgi:hypothetical protein
VAWRSQNESTASHQGGDVKLLKAFSPHEMCFRVAANPLHCQTVFQRVSETQLQPVLWRRV